MEASPDLIPKLAQSSLQDFIFSHEGEDEVALVLKRKEINGIASSLVAEQIKGRRKAKEKLPSWFNTKGVVYPPSINLEQSSSETTAAFKAGILKGLVPVMHSLCDLTGGFGVDAFFFSKVFKEVEFTEPNSFLVQLARHNHGLLGTRNISYSSITAETLLERRGIYDCLFVDPSRRNERGRVFRFSDCQPDVTQLQKKWFGHADVVMIKASPLVDIQRGFAELTSARSCHIVSVDNECKELIFLCVRNFSGTPMVHCVDLWSSSGGGPVLVPRTDTFSFDFAEERSATIQISQPGKYLYEPYTSILKGGAFRLVGQRYQLSKVHPNTHLYTSNEPHPHFPGRVFEVSELVKLDKKIVEKFPRGQANIVTRNYPLDVEEIKKKTGLTEGGFLYLLAFTAGNEKVAAVANRIR